MPLFAGTHSTIADFLHGSSNLLIPEYQREYSWKEENVLQLLRDVEHGISRLDAARSRSDRVESGSKFLGCVIQWERDARANEDYADAPGISFITRVCELIDGQQRTSTIVLALCELYLLLEELSSDLDTRIPQEREFSLFIAKVQDSWLLPKFARVGSTGALPSHRPVIIRQGSDKWTHAGVAQYQSSVASYVHRLLANIDAGRPLYRPIGVGQDIKDVLDALREQFTERSQHPVNYLRNNYDQAELLQELCTGRSRTDLVAYLSTAPANERHIRGMVSLVAFAHYLLHYCAITVITSRDQDIALDMFQSLNATGVQLTAVQLLKPRISQSFRVNGLPFSSDPVFGIYEEVNSWLNSGRNSSTRTAQFFLKFGLAIFGVEPPSSLSGQRSWLLRTFQTFTSDGANLHKTREFIRLMRSVTEYLRLFYFEPRDQLFVGTNAPMPGSRRVYEKFRLTHGASGTTYSLSEPVIVAFMFLVDAKHDLAHSFLALCYTKFQESSAADALTAKGEFEKVLLAVTGCFVIWRASFSEKYPDSAYRVVLSKVNYLTFTGRARDIGRSLSIELRKKHKSVTPRSPFPALMAGGLKYQGGMHAILRFVLILAAHRKVPLSPGAPTFSELGLVVADPAGPDYLHPDIWLDSEYKSIEHIAPQKLLEWTGATIPHWTHIFSTASASVHSIGNLTLLSLALNASTPEDTSAKCNHYGALVAPGAAAGVTPTAASLMATSPLLSHLVPVYVRLMGWMSDIAAGRSPSPNAWDEQFIRRRAENIAIEVGRDLVAWVRTR